MSKRILTKVVVYITHKDHLLVFRHTQFPEAGIQVPAGTVEPGEQLAEAVLREAAEETGLNGLQLRSYLGGTEFDGAPFGIEEIHQRHFFHLEFLNQPPRTWKHCEMHASDGSAAPIEFQFFWVKYPEEVPDLIGGFGELLPQLPIY